MSTAWRDVRDEKGNRVSSRSTSSRSVGKLATSHQRLVSKSTTALGDRHDGCNSQRRFITLGESEALDRLDDVLKRMFSVRVLGKVVPGAEEHCQCLERQLVYIQGEGFEWLEDPKHTAAIIQNHSKVGAKPQSSPQRKDMGPSDPDALDELPEQEAKMYQQDTAVSIHVSREAIRQTILREEVERDDVEAMDGGDLHLATLARNRSYRSGPITRKRETPSEFQLTPTGRVGLECHGGHIVDSWVASGQVRTLSSGEAELNGIVDGSARGIFTRTRTRRWDETSTLMSRRIPRQQTECAPEQASGRRGTRSDGCGSRTLFVTESCVARDCTTVVGVPNVCLLVQGTSKGLQGIACNVIGNGTKERSRQHSFLCIAHDELTTYVHAVT